MGTRNLTIIKVDGKYPLANYGQWDGYPSGQGLTILRFLRREFKPSFIYKKLPKVKDLTDKESEVVLKKITGSTDGGMTTQQFNEWKKYFPYADRNLGGEILHLINVADADEIKITNMLDFAADSLFCEWAYVVDFDTNKFEVFQGFNKTPLTEKDRFFFLQEKSERGYFPVKLVASFDLNKLPTKKEFLSHFEDKGN